MLPGEWDDGDGSKMAESTIATLALISLCTRRRVEYGW